MNSGWLIGGWFFVAAVCVAVLGHDLRTKNDHLAPLMKWVWILTVVYAGPIGLAIYFWSGRRQISRDSLPRRAFRSVAHCYSGCGLGEIMGVIIAAGLLAAGNWTVAITTFTLAYVMGFALTVGPLLQEGVSLKTAIIDAFWAESASIAVMEVTAIAVDLWLAAQATMGEPRFWSSLVVSLVVGLFAAYPVNVLLIHYGVKEGMHSPRHIG